MHGTCENTFELSNLEGLAMAVSGVNSSASSAAKQAANWAAVEQKQTAQVKNTPETDPAVQGATAAKPAAQNTTATKPASPAQTVDVFETTSTQQTPQAQGTKTLEVKQDPTVKDPEPPIPSNTNTVQAGTVTLDEPTKRARGAVNIDEAAKDPNYSPKQFDGWYIGSDRWAYPPDKFSISEVPPFQPNKPVSNPPPTTYYVNGILTQPLGDDQAAGEAQKLANKTGTNVVLIYNATEGEQADVIQAGMDRLNIGDNKATETLTNAIYNDLKEGKQVNVIGYSQGGAIASSALRDVDERLKADYGGNWRSDLPFGLGDDNQKKREQTLSNVNVTSIGGAGKTFPNGPNYNFYVNNNDPVPTLFGSHEPNWVTDVGSAVLASQFPLFGVLNGGSSIQWPRGSQFHTFGTNGKDPNPLSVNGAHGINTYLGTIQDLP